MKIPRFVREYANYMNANDRNSEYVSDAKAEENRIVRERAIRSCEQGLIPVSEAMRIIAR